MTTVTLTPSTDKIFDTLWGVVSSLFDPTIAPLIFKGFQNNTPTPLGSYVVIQEGVAERQDQGRQIYDPINGLMHVKRGTMYSFQVDCYGPSGSDWANIIAIAWRSPWACDQFAGTEMRPLYADEPQQLNIVNGELEYESRFMCKLYLQATQSIALPQQFFTGPVPLIRQPPNGS
jgi:hypothetical protein